MPRRQESDSPFPSFQSCSRWLHGGQGLGRAGDWKSNPRGAGLPGDDSRHFLIIDNRRPFLTSWRHTLADWLVIALAPSCSHLYLAGEMQMERESRQARAPNAESAFEPQTSPLGLLLLATVPPAGYIICGMVFEWRTWNREGPAGLC